VTGGLLAASTYNDLVHRHATDQLELKPRRRGARYVRLEIVLALLALIVAVAVGLQPAADREAGRLDALAQVRAAAAPVASALHEGNIAGAQQPTSI
jgi:uncharacterized membrane protein